MRNWLESDGRRTRMDQDDGKMAAQLAICGRDHSDDRHTDYEAALFLMGVPMSGQDLVESFHLLPDESLQIDFKSGLTFTLSRLPAAFLRAVVVGGGVVHLHWRDDWDKTLQWEKLPVRSSCKQ